LRRAGRRPKKPDAADPAALVGHEAATEESVVTMSDLSLHKLFQQQTQTLLERADINEEQKQSILLALGCPCCGATEISFRMKLKKDF
jgi:hypothetical protein